MASGGINGAAVALMAAGGVVIWSGLNNTDILETLRALAKGQAPPAHRNPAFVDISAGSGGAAAGVDDITGGGNSAIVAEAAKWKGTKYVYGGCHGSTPCHPGQGVDCSSYVTWVMRAVGCWHGKTAMVAGSSMLAWGKKIPAGSEQPGDVVLWVGQHCGIVSDPGKKLMWNAPHTGDVVKNSTYSFAIPGHPKVFLRAPCTVYKTGPSGTGTGSL